MDLFNKEFIFFVIFDNKHYSLLVVCYPNALPLLWKDRLAGTSAASDCQGGEQQGRSISGAQAVPRVVHLDSLREGKIPEVYIASRIY